MYIIDESYFIKQYIIPNSVETDVSGNTETFEVWIDSKARLCLQEALGTTLFNDLDSNVASGVYTPGVTKWDNLVNGVEYTYQGKTYSWKGLIYTEGTFKGSLLVPFVYSEWLRYENTRMTGVGEVTGQAINAMNVNSTYRYVSVWNEFVKQYQGGSNDGSYPKITVKNGIPLYDYFGGDETYVSLLKFLLHNPTDYPNPSLKCYEFTNTLGI